MSSRDSSSSSPSSPELTRRAEKVRSPIKGSKPQDAVWQVAGRPRRRSPRMSPEEDTPTRCPVPERSRSPSPPPLNLESDVEFPSLILSGSGSASPIENPFAQRVKAAVKRR